MHGIAGIIFYILMFTLTNDAQVTTIRIPPKGEKIDRFLSTLHSQGQFSGAVLVAEHGHLIFKKGYGFADNNTKEPFTTSTPSYIGSLSKQFTAMGIMILAEKGKLDYNQSIRHYFPDLPVCMHAVTILHLLHHTSGLATFNDYPDMNEQDVYTILLHQEALHFTPGTKYEYCNAGYTLLGLLIEKISASSLNDFLTTYVFQPTGMKNTYVNTPTLKNRKRAIGYYLFGNENNYDTFIGGSASIISTVDDLYQWDQSLYYPKIITRKTLNDAFTMEVPAGNDDRYGKKYYGFGWLVSEVEGKKIVQHDGGFGGFRAYIERQPDSKNTLLFISNVRHALTGEIRQGLMNILENKPFVIPKISLANWLMTQSKEKGMVHAVQGLNDLLKSSENAQYYFNEDEFNSLGYYLIRAKRIDDALTFFNINVDQYPQSANVYDSRGEAHMIAGNTDLALRDYKKSLALNPNNRYAKELILKFESAVINHETRIQRIENNLIALNDSNKIIFPQHILARMQAMNISGISVAVFDHNQIIWARSYGIKDKSASLPVDANTLFQAASISKPVSTTGMFRLVEKNILSLDEDVNKKLRHWKLPENDFTIKEKVTPRRIVSHLAGLTVHGFFGYSATEKLPTLIDILNGIPPANSEPVRVNMEPGTSESYSGGGFVLMQLLMSDVTEKSFEQLMKELVLLPIGMNQSTFEQPLPDSLIPLAAKGYSGSGEMIDKGYHIYPEQAAAGLWTTPSDLAKFMITISKSYQGAQGILKQKTVQEMLTKIPGAGGLGFGVDGSGESFRFRHNGGNEGYRCYAVAFPKYGRGVVVMTNSDNGSPLIHELVRSVANEYHWAPMWPRE